MQKFVIGLGLMAAGIQVDAVSAQPDLQTALISDREFYRQTTDGFTSNNSSFNIQSPAHRRFAHISGEALGESAGTISLPGRADIPLALDDAGNFNELYFLEEHTTLNSFESAIAEGPVTFDITQGPFAGFTTTYTPPQGLVGNLVPRFSQQTVAAIENYQLGDSLFVQVEVDPIAHLAGQTADFQLWFSTRTPEGEFDSAFPVVDPNSSTFHITEFDLGIGITQEVEIAGFEIARRDFDPQYISPYARVTYETSFDAGDAFSNGLAGTYRYWSFTESQGFYVIPSPGVASMCLLAIGATTARRRSQP